MAVMAQTSVYPTRDGRRAPIFIARPDVPGQLPAIVMGYEVFGLTEAPEGGPHMREVAARFARDGYVAAIPDYYAARGKQPVITGNAVTGGPSEEEVAEDLLDALSWLKAQTYVAPDRIGAVGWCGGGRNVLVLAARAPEIRVAASFYGRLSNRPGTPGPSPIDSAPVYRCRVFGAYGEDDHAIPVASARQFEQALRLAGVRHDMHVYAGAGHAFMNDRRGSYVPAAAADAWQKLLAVLATELKTPNEKP
jgi:carboxymethylenebutenolidase